MRYVGQEIYSVIPNRYPLMILDAIEIDENKAVSRLLLKEDDWFFECHYPDKPILPACLLLESMTQTFSAIFLSQIKDKEIPILSKISELNIKEGATVGDKIRIEAELKSFRRGVAKGSCIAYKEGEIEKVMLNIDIIEILPSQMVRVQ